MMFKGMMDGHSEDDFYCKGFCGICDECDARFYEKCDEQYDSMREEQL